MIIILNKIRGHNHRFDSEILRNIAHRILFVSVCWSELVSWLVDIVKQVAQDIVVSLRDSVVEILRVHWVLLHLLELESLKDVLQEELMSLIDTSHVVHHHLVLSLQNLYFSKGKLGVQAETNSIKVKNIFAEVSKRELFDER